MKKKYMLITLATLLGAFCLQAEKPMRKGAKKGAAPMAGRMLEMMDTDKDGKVSKAEWQAHHDKKFAEIDADNDGSIVAAEIKAHHQQMQEKRGEMCPDCQRNKKGMRKGQAKKGADDEEE